MASHDYMRDYEVFIYATGDPRTGIAPEHLRYRFVNCVRAVVTSALTPETWKRSLDERLVGYEQGSELDGYVWGVKWQALYPGLKLVRGSVEAERWSRGLGIPFYEAVIETNGHNISLVFSDLAVDMLEIGHAPFVVCTLVGLTSRFHSRSWRDPGIVNGKDLTLRCALIPPVADARSHAEKQIFADAPCVCRRSGFYLP